MKITMGLMADYASIDAAGKMYLVGVFGRLNYPTYPLTLQMMYLALKLDIPMSEWDKSRTLTIRLVGEDKPESFQIGPFPIEVPKVQVPPGVTVMELPVIARIDNLEIARPGTYHWSVMIDSNTEFTIGMVAAQIAL